MTVKTIEGVGLNSSNARPLAMLVQVASRFESSIYIDNGEMKANAKSIMGMMTMTLNPDKVVTISADGPDEPEAIAAMEQYIMKLN